MRNTTDIGIARALRAGLDEESYRKVTELLEDATANLAVDADEKRNLLQRRRAELINDVVIALHRAR